MHACYGHTSQEHNKKEFKLGPHHIILYHYYLLEKHRGFIADKEIEGSICCGGHVAVRYGEELLYLRIFLYLSPPSKRGLPFTHGLNHMRILVIAQ